MMHRQSPNLNGLAIFAVILLVAVAAQASAQDTPELKGDHATIEDAVAMVESMGGMAIWRDLAAVHFVHEWDIVNRPDRYLENEILDLIGPRSHVTMESEINSRMRAYSPEHRYWSINNGEFEYGSEELLERAMERAPYSLYRLARAVARGDSDIVVRFGTIDGISNLPALEFIGSDGAAHGWILLNTRKEPTIWATTQYIYVLGPLAEHIEG
jgi:hypothetical protein